MTERKRIGIFGWGLVAPQCPDVDVFTKKLEAPESWLTPFSGFGPSNFIVGQPLFDFNVYRPWFDARFSTSKFSQLREKMGPNVQYALGSFIQALSQNDGLETYLQELGARCHILIGTGLGEITIQHEQSLRYERARTRWNEFWAHPDRCAQLRAHVSGVTDTAAPDFPANHSIGTEEWIDAKHAWEEYWAAKSDSLATYLSEASEIQSEPVPPTSSSASSAKLGMIRQKLNRIKALNRKWGCPEEPWAAVSPNLLWNIANIPASQISMAGRIMGPAYAPVAACASFGLALKIAADAIHLGEATAVVVGATDPPPHGVSISAFYNANVLSADAGISRPLTGLKGTHVAGGACVWIVGDAEAMMSKGFRPLGLEIVSVGSSSDAHHIITPSKAGPQLAIREALRDANPRDLTTWDMHATATPGDTSEIENSLEVLHGDILFTARKGTFGHGMSVGGGWELTAQHLGVKQGRLYPTLVTEDELHADVRIHDARFVERTGSAPAVGLSGKLSMGIGGINSCVISRSWDEEYVESRLKHAESEPQEEPTLSE